MRNTIIVMLMLLTSHAHAMGSDVQLELVAWNGDGSSALLLQRVHAAETVGDTANYVVVTVKEPKPLMVPFSDTTHERREPAKQGVDLDTCVNAMGTLKKALEAKNFRGVTVVADRCKSAERNVVSVTTEAGTAVQLSWVATPKGRAPYDREKAAWGAAKAAVGGDDHVDVAAWGGASNSAPLILVFEYSQGNPEVTKVVAFAINQATDKPRSYDKFLVVY